MNILMVTVNDPAGMAIAFTRAINNYTEHTCRLITLQDRYGIDFGKDVHLPDIHDDDFSEVEYLLQQADIFHFHMLSDENMHLGPLVVSDYTKGKSILHHQHGHPDFILNVEKFNEKYKRLKRKVIVSTPDLLKITDKSTWIPNLVPLNDVNYLPRYDDTLSSEVIKICQAPTRKFDKHFEEFNAVFNDLNRKYKKLEKVVIERKPHVECLGIKKKCHIIFDHMRGWFGISSLESLAQGKSVIAGLDDWNIECIQDFTGVEGLPWQIARSEKELYSVLERLIDDPSFRLFTGKKSRQFMEHHWKEEDVLRELVAVYNVL